jgi:pyruvate/2-oxoglutarate dehydrogenase complex dihydrolipoamide acyltransferase (E2) component
MRYEFRLPDIGEGLTEAVIASWAIKVGDVISEDDPLCEIETDKALVEITAPCSGTILSLRGEPGETLKVGTVVTVFETDKLPAGAAHPEHGDAAADAVAASALGETTLPDAPASVTTGPATAVRHDVRATPATRHYAREQNIDLNHVVGTGPNGRVLQHDVARFVDGGQAGQPTRCLLATALPWPPYRMSRASSGSPSRVCVRS